MKIGSCFVCGLNGKESNGANRFKNGRLVTKLSPTKETKYPLEIPLHAHDLLWRGVISFRIPCCINAICSREGRAIASKGD